MMAMLLTIPRELRNQILGYVIQSHHNEAPTLNQPFERLIQDREILSNPKLKSWNKLVLNYPKGPIPNATALLLTNCQLHVETLESIMFLNAYVYELDVIILDEILLLPTWTSVPLLTTTLDKVNVTFRISGCYDASKEHSQPRDEEGSSPGPYTQYGRYKGFGGGCGAGPAMGWQIYSILERFIKAGPRGEMENKDEHHHLVVKSIYINIVTPSDVDSSLFGQPRSIHSARRRGNPNSVLDPQYLAIFVAGNIDKLLNGGDIEWFQYGQILYEHVDHIVVTLDGKDFWKCDIAERLRALEGFEERHITEEGLAEYKRATWKKRTERGLQAFWD